MSVNLSPLGGAGAQFFTNNGVPLAGGLLYTYLAGTSTPATSYTSSSGGTALANPIVLDAGGRVPTGEIWLTDGINYKFVLKDATGALIATWDGLSGINSNFIAYTSIEETATATAGQTVFNLTLTYVPATNNLAVYVNGSNQIVSVNYTETDADTVTFLAGLNVGDVVKFSTATPVATNAMDASNVSYTPAGASAVVTNVQAKLRQTVSVKDFGAVGDGVTDDTVALNACALYCLNNDRTMFISAGVYKVSSAITASCSILGESPLTSVIKNYGTGDALDLSGSAYYTTFENFSIDGSGNVASRDGISLYNGSGNPAYCHFFNVYSNNNGRHGLYHRYAWGTRYSQCKFAYNAGLGVYLDTQVTDTGSANGVTFIQCDSRHNGGSTSGFGGDFGGVKVQGAAIVSWLGGIIESNNGFGVYVGAAPSGPATRNVQFKQTYFEFNGWGVTDGATFYVTGPWANFDVEDCWISYGTTAGNTHTLYYVGTSLDGGNFVERNNTLVNVGGGGTINKYGGTHFASPRTALSSAPTVYAYQDVATTLVVPNATFTKIPLNVEAWDSNNNYDTALYRFTPTVAGYYRVNARANYFPNGGTNFFVSVYQNGLEVYRGVNVDNSTAAATGAGVDCMVYANGMTDYFELFVFQTSGSSQNYNPGFALCGMQIDYARNP